MLLTTIFTYFRPSWNGKIFLLNELVCVSLFVLESRYKEIINTLEEEESLHCMNSDRMTSSLGKVFALLHILCVLASPPRAIRVINLVDIHVPSMKIDPIFDTRSILISYEESLRWQSKLMDYYISLQDDSLKNIEQDKTVGTLLLLQHKSVYTRGSSSTPESGPFRRLLNDGTHLEYEVIDVERGGQVTYHGPGQLVVYPIIDLNYFGRDINIYLRSLEESILKTFQSYGVQAYTIPGLTGVWYDDVKLAAIGIKISRWVTQHGLSVNVNPDMNYFDNIVPCGIKDKQAGKLIDYTKVNVETVAEQYCHSFNEVFNTYIEEQLTGIDGIKFLQNIPRIGSNR